jgi:hypothetical protein
MNKTKNTKLFAAFAAIALFAGTVSPAFAVENNGIGGRPANPRAENPRSESIFIYNLKAGDTAKDGIRVLNNSSAEKTILVYATDSEYASGGAFTCAQMVDLKKDVGNWITLEKSEVTLKPYTNEVVPFTITAVGTADVGEHNGCIVVEEKPAATEMTNQNSINISLRSGLRVAVTIPGDIKRGAEIAGFSVTDDNDGMVRFHPKMTNTGNVSLDTNIDIFTKYFFGRDYQKHGGKFPLMAGQTGEWNFEMARPFWGGWYRTQFSASYDDGAAAGIGVASGDEFKSLKSKELWYFVMPSLYAMIIEIAVLLIIVLFIFLTIVHLRRNAWINKHWSAYAVKSGDDIHKLADRYSVSWKLIAKVNKIKPPYTLKSGAKLRVPPVHKKK